jgi:hypothetical protein
VRASPDVERATRAPDVERPLLLGRPRWLVGHASRPPVYAGQATPHEPGREGHCRPRHRADFGPVAQEFKKNPFLLFEIIWTVLNFENSHLSVQSSKIYEISSIGFIIS